jgi:hypothetical protein
VLHLQAGAAVVLVGVTEVQDLPKVELPDKQDLLPAMAVATLVPKAQLVDHPLLMPQRYIRVQVYIPCNSQRL